jgi:hypothetical protein
LSPGLIKAGKHIAAARSVAAMFLGHQKNARLFSGTKRIVQRVAGHHIRGAL